MKPENLENWDKVKSEYTKEGIRSAIKCGHWVTINDDGLYMIDLIPDPGFSGAYMIVKEENKENN